MFDRIESVQKVLKDKKLLYILVTSPTNIRYLSGFYGASPEEREASLLVGTDKTTLFAPKLYQEEALNLKSNVLNVVITEERDSIFADPVKNIAKGSSVGVESENLTLAEFNLLKNLRNLSFVETENIVEKLRIFKSTAEIELIKNAVQITDLAFEKIKKVLGYNMTEKEIGKIMTEYMEEDGADGIAFEPIVASGVNSALPHYISGNKKIEKGVVLIDAGARYKGYCGDLTRTFCIGKPDKTFTKCYNLLLEVQNKALSNLKPGITEEEIWQRTMEDLGEFSQYFTHGLGHGVGLQIHEKPYLRKGRPDKIMEGMAITIEPGIYIPDWGGIRIEDYCLVTENGCEVLSKTPKTLDSSIIQS